MPPRLASRRTFIDDMHLDAAPPEVFALLCPVREYDWIDTWRCEIVHTASGVAEDGCIFTTDFDADGPMTWVVSRYEPPRAIQFTCIVPVSYVMRLRIDVTPSDGGSELRWTREFTALSDRGAVWVAGYDAAAHRARMAGLRTRLAHYLATGARYEPSTGTGRGAS